MKLKTSTLSEICKIGDGAHASLKRHKYGVPYITAKNITSNGIDYSNLDFIDEETYCKYFKPSTTALTQPLRDDILYSIIGSIGGAYILKDERVGISSSVAIFRCDQNIVLPKYLFYLLKSDMFNSKIQSLKGGVAQGFLSLSKLGSIEVTYHKDKCVQKKIVDILSNYDNLIENNQKQIKLLEEAAQRLYKEWFVDLHFPGYESATITDGVPEGWNKRTVDSIVNLLSGYAFKSTTFDNSGDFKIVTIKNVQDGFFDGENVNRILEMPSKMPYHCVLQDGDILLSLTGNVGRVCLVNGEKYLLNQRVAKLDSKFKGYTYCLFRSKDMFDAMNNLANGAAQQNLSPIRTGNIEILIPNDSLLLDFEKIINPMIKKILILNKEISDLKQARDRLLPKLMSGEIEV